MGIFRKYSQAGGAIHDLGHIGELSSDRTIPLLLSPQVLYVLQNLANQDVAFECRWATELQSLGYIRLTTDDTEYSLFAQVVSDVGLQLRERQAGQLGTLLNFAGTHYQEVFTTSAIAGTNTLSITVPAGYAWVIETYQVVNINTANTAIVIAAGDGLGGTVQMESFAGSAGVVQRGHVSVTLSGDNVLNAVFVGCSAGDDIYLRAWGYLMELVP